MKKYFFSFLFLIAATSLVFAATGANEIEQAFAKAFNANDLEAMMALYAPDAVFYPPEVFETKGIEAIRKNYQELLTNYTVKDFKIFDSHHETQGAVSIGWGGWSMSLVPKAPGEAMELKGRYTDVAKKIQGKWLFIADHVSVPLPPPPSPTVPAK